LASSLNPPQINLYLGVPVKESIYSNPSNGPWATSIYFIYIIDQATVGVSGFRVTVSNLDAGKDVDLFVGDPTIPYPNITRNTVASLSGWAEIVDIGPNTVPPLNNCGGGLCAYYFGVSPYTTGQHFFTIEVSLLGAPVTLYDGVPVDGSQQAGTTGLYNFGFPLVVRSVARGMVAMPPVFGITPLCPLLPLLPLQV
jgi:hypothetical protein